MFELYHLVEKQGAFYQLVEKGTYDILTTTTFHNISRQRPRDLSLSYIEAGTGTGTGLNSATRWNLYLSIYLIYLSGKEAEFIHIVTFY